MTAVVETRDPRLSAPVSEPGPLPVPSVRSSLDLLRASINKAVTPVDTTLDVEVDYREGWQVRFSVVHPYEDVLIAASSARDDNLPGGTNYMQLGTALGLELCRGLLIDGQEVLDDDGRPLTFGSKALHEIMGVSGEGAPTKCLRAVFSFPTEEANGRVVWKVDDFGISALGQKLFHGLGGKHPTRR